MNHKTVFETLNHPQQRALRLADPGRRFDIDPEWIESLNTVMDDNKTLTLVNNERISVTNPMRLIFEISNLDNATLATVFNSTLGECEPIRPQSQVVPTASAG